MGKRGNEKRKGETARRIWEALRSPTPESESSFSENSTVSERLARFDERAQYQKCQDCQKVVMAQGSTDSCCLKVRLALLTEDVWRFASVHDWVDVTWESCRTEAKRRCGLGDTHTELATEEKTPRKTKRSATARAKKKASKTKTSGAKKEVAGKTSKSATAGAKKKVSKKKKKANQLQDPVASASMPLHVAKCPPSPPASWATS